MTRIVVSGGTTLCHFADTSPAFRRQLVSTLARSNPKLSRPSAYTRTPIGGREGLVTVLSNVSSANGRPERIAVYTTLLRDGALFYAIGVAPGDRYPEYEGTFGRVVESVQLMD